MPYYRLFYHFIWSTKNRQPIITPQAEDILKKTIEIKIVGLGGRYFAVNACRDHVHVVVSIPPSISVSRFIGQVKGVSSLKVNNAEILPEIFQWQNEYSVFTLDESRLSACITYVEHQKEHHMGLGKLEACWE